MVRRGVLERCETGANPLETWGKRKPVTPENDPRETGLSFVNGGGGGSRTYVGPYSHKGLQRFTECLPNIYSGRNRSICRQRVILYSPIARVVFPLGKRMNFKYFP